MKITIKYSGLLSEMLGVYLEELEIPSSVNLKELVEILASRHPQLRVVLENIPVIQFYLNNREVLPGSSNIVLKDHDEITISLPMFEGG